MYNVQCRIENGSCFQELNKTLIVKKTFKSARERNKVLINQNMSSN